MPQSLEQRQPLRDGLRVIHNNFKNGYLLMYITPPRLAASIGHRQTTLARPMPGLCTLLGHCRVH